MPVKSIQVKSPIIRNLSGGLNIRESVTDLGDNEGYQASNAVYFTAGSLVRRGGWKKLIANSPTTNKLLGIYQATFNLSNALTYYLVITDGTDIWYSSNPTAATVTWNKITGSLTLDNSQPYRFLMLKNILIGYNGKAVFQWSGSANAAAMPAGYASLVIQHLTYTSICQNTGAVTVAYYTGGTAGQETVAVVSTGITITIQSGVSTAQQIQTAFNNSAAAMALASVTVSGTGSNAQTGPVAESATYTLACPLSRAGIIWSNYVCWGGGTQGGTYYPNRLFFSDLAQPTSYPQANFIDIPSPDDGDPIVGFGILFGNLFIFKRFSLYILQGALPDNTILSKMNASVGCIDPNSILQLDNLIYFVSDKGLYEANLFNVRQACYKVEPRYTVAVPQSSAANPISIAHYKPKGQLFVSINAQHGYKTSPPAQNDRIMCHDYFNADANGDPTVSEFVVGYTVYGLQTVKPSNPTGPSLMDQYFYPGTPSQDPTVMASFYDQWVYVFSDGILPNGGPPDSVAWLSSPTYPPADFLSKFYDFGDPDMIKQARWLWATGQSYNNIAMEGMVVYSDSPTAESFVDYYTIPLTLQAPNGNLYNLTVDNDGAIDLVLTTDGTFVTTIVLQDANKKAWNFGVDNDGALDVTASTASTTNAPIIAALNGTQYELGVTTNGVATTAKAFTYSFPSITPGQRNAIGPLVNSLISNTYGKYMQFYITQIGILTQVSFDMLMKGRRN